MILLTLAAAALSAPCPAERAQYRQRTAPTVTARFIPVASGRDWHAGVALAIHFKDSGRTRYFLPWNGGTNGLLYATLLSVDPTLRSWQPPAEGRINGRSRDFMYLGFDGAYKVLPAVPHRRQAAPVHFILPEASDALWHDINDRRERMPIQMFDLVRCSVR